MAARSILHLFHADPEGDVIAGRAIAVTRPDGSALGVGLYDQPSGGTPNPAPTTDSVGTKLLYADFSALDAAAVGRVKVAYGDDVGTTFDDAFWPDPLDLFVDGMTRPRSLGGPLTVGGAFAAAAGDVQHALTTTSPTLPTLRLRNTDPGDYVLRADDQSGNPMLTVNQSLVTILDPMKLAIGPGMGAPDPRSLWIYKHGPPTGWTLQYNILDIGNTDGTADESAGSFFIRQRSALGSPDTAQARAIEVHAIRDTGTTGSFMGIECGIHASVGSANTGIHVISNVAMFIAGAVPKAPSTGILFDSQAGSGVNGYEDVICYRDKTETKKLMRIAGGATSGDRAGDVMTAGDIYSAPVAGLASTGNGGDRVGVLNFTVAPAGRTWAGLTYDNFAGALLVGAHNGTTGAKPVLFDVTAASGVAVGIGSAVVFPASRLAVNGAIGYQRLASAAPNPHASLLNVYADTSDRLHRRTSGGTDKVVADQATRLVNTPFGSLTGAGLVVNGTTQTDIPGATATFTVQSTSSVVVVTWRGYIQCSQTAGAGGVTSQMILDGDGANPLRIGGDRVNTGGNFANPLAGAGPVVLTGLSAGSHTVKLALYCELAGTAHMRANGVEHLTVSVTEHP